MALFLKYLFFISLLLSLTSCTSVVLLGTMAIHPTILALKKDRNFKFKHEGYAFEAMIEGVPIIELSNSDEYMALKNYYDKQSIHWRTMKPISGKVVIEIKRKYIKEYELGKIDRSSLKLSYIKLPSDFKELQKIKKNPVVDYGSIVMIGNRVINNSRASKAFPLLMLQEGDVLASGNYIIFMEIKGSKSWDRKNIYVEVRANAKHQKFL